MEAPRGAGASAASDSRRDTPGTHEIERQNARDALRNLRGIAREARACSHSQHALHERARAAMSELEDKHAKLKEMGIVLQEESIDIDSAKSLAAEVTEEWACKDQVAKECEDTYALVLARYAARFGVPVEDIDLDSSPAASPRSAAPPVQHHVAAGALANVSTDLVPREGIGGRAAAGAAQPAGDFPAGCRVVARRDIIVGGRTVARQYWLGTVQQLPPQLESISGVRVLFDKRRLAVDVPPRTLRLKDEADAAAAADQGAEASRAGTAAVGDPNGRKAALMELLEEEAAAAEAAAAAEPKKKAKKARKPRPGTERACGKLEEHGAPAKEPAAGAGEEASVEPRPQPAMPGPESPAGAPKEGPRPPAKGAANSPGQGQRQATGKKGESAQGTPPGMKKSARQPKGASGRGKPQEAIGEDVSVTKEEAACPEPAEQGARSAPMSASKAPLEPRERGDRGTPKEQDRRLESKDKQHSPRSPARQGSSQQAQSAAPRPGSKRQPAAEPVPHTREQLVRRLEVERARNPSFGDAWNDFLTGNGLHSASRNFARHPAELLAQALLVLAPEGTLPPGGIVVDAREGGTDTDKGNICAPSTAKAAPATPTPKTGSEAAAGAKERRATREKPSGRKEQQGKPTRDAEPRSSQGPAPKGKPTQGQQARETNESGSGQQGADELRQKDPRAEQQRGNLPVPTGAGAAAPAFGREAPAAAGGRGKGAALAAGQGAPSARAPPRLGAVPQTQVMSASTTTMSERLGRLAELERRLDALEQRYLPRFLCAMRNYKRFCDEHTEALRERAAAHRADSARLSTTLDEIRQIEAELGGRPSALFCSRCLAPQPIPCPEVRIPLEGGGALLFSPRLKDIVHWEYLEPARADAAPSDFARPVRRLRWDAGSGVLHVGSRAYTPLRSPWELELGCLLAQVAAQHTYRGDPIASGFPEKWSPCGQCDRYRVAAEDPQDRYRALVRKHGGQPGGIWERQAREREAQQARTRRLLQQGPPRVPWHFPAGRSASSGAERAA
eukprot:TRINITY_DN36952_c0_g1_i1.p1 TRINITY_DN36952_c0_g1~~TRINITY_DN36952_c0_g1_i1.p1  ORF type:complete len:1019 (+),score=159.52 TRINITY_DN36952_c0_g1_i1:69-3125(+)